MTSWAAWNTPSGKDTRGTELQGCAQHRPHSCFIRRLAANVERERLLQKRPDGNVPAHHGARLRGDQENVHPDRNQLQYAEGAFPEDGWKWDAEEEWAGSGLRGQVVVNRRKR